MTVYFLYFCVTGRKGYSWEQIRIQIYFSLCILDIGWNMLDYLQSTYLQEPWVNCPNLPCKAESFSLCPPTLNCLMQEMFSRSWPRLQLFPLLPLLVRSSFCLPTFSWGMRDAFHFLETSGCAVESVVSWGMVARRFWTAAQGRPELTAHEP